MHNILLSFYILLTYKLEGPQFQQGNLFWKETSETHPTNPLDKWQVQTFQTLTKSIFH